MSRNVGVIRRCSYLLPYNVLRSLHYSFVISHMSYAITAYGYAQSNATRKISNLVDKSIRLISGVERLTFDTHRDQEILSFSQTVEYFTAIKMYQIIKQDHHPYLMNRIEGNQIRHNISTRFSRTEMLTLPFMRFTKCQRSFIYTGIKVWNKLPIEIRNTDKLNTFKRSLKSFLLNGIG